MTDTIDYYFICSSPFAYLGHEAFHDLAARHEATIRYRPIDIRGVWANSGSVPLGERTPLRQRYRRVELQRFAEWRGLPLHLEPKYFPVDSALADKVAIVLVESGRDPSGFVWRTHRGVWANGENIADAAQLSAYLEAENHDPQPLIEFAQSARGGNPAGQHEGRCRRRCGRRARLCLSGRAVLGSGQARPSRSHAGNETGAVPSVGLDTAGWPG